MGYGFVPQKAVSVANGELRRIQHHQDFGIQCLDSGFASLARDQLRNLIAPFHELLLEALQYRDTHFHRQISPCRLRLSRTPYCFVNFLGRGARQLAQRLAGRRIGADNGFPYCDFSGRVHNAPYSTLTR